MTADLTREQAREQVARALYDANERMYSPPIPWDYRGGSDVDAVLHEQTKQISREDADAALTVLWPVVESLRAERDEARRSNPLHGPYPDEFRLPLDDETADCEAHAEESWEITEEPFEAYRAEVDRLTAELAHAHTVIARHVEPLRKPCRPEAGDCCDGSAHTWQPAQGSRLPDRVGGNTPSDALCGDLSHQTPGSGVSGRDGQDGGR